MGDTYLKFMVAMILKLFRGCVVFLIALTITLWIGMQTEKMQSWAKQTIAKSVETTAGYEMTLKNIGGLLPFYVTLEHITLKKSPSENIAIESITIVPNWFGFLLGNHSFFYIGIDSADFRGFKGNSKTAAVKTHVVTPRPLHIWNYQIDTLFLPYEYNTFLLNDLNDEVEVGIYYDISGKIHYKPNVDSLSATINIAPIAQDEAFANGFVKIDVSKDKIRIDAALDAVQVSDGSVFKQIPCDELHIGAKLQANTQLVLQAIRSNAKPPATLFTGTWNLRAIKKKERAPISPYYQLNVSGTLAVPNLVSMNFSTTKMRFQEINTFMSQEMNPQTLGLQNNRSVKETYFSDIPLKGKVTGSCRIQDERNIAISLESDELTVTDTTVKPLKIQTTLSSVDDVWKGTIQFSLEFQKQKPFSLSGYTDYASDAKTFISFSNGSLTLAKHPIAFDLKCLFFPLQIDGKIESTSSDMSGLLDVFGYSGNAQGRVFCNFEPITTQTLSQVVTASIEVDSIQAKELILDKGLVSIKSQGLLNAPFIFAKLSLENLQTPQNMYEKLHIESEINCKNDDPSRLRMAINGYTDTEPFSLNCEASCTLQNDLSCSIDKLDFQVAKYQAQIEAPIRIEQDEKGLRVLPFSILCDGKEILAGSFARTFAKTLSGAFTGPLEKSKETINGQITIADFPLALFGPLSPCAMYGTVSGQAELYGLTASPQFHVSAASSDFSLLPPNTFDLLPQMLTLQMQYINNLLVIDTEIQNFRIPEPIVGRLEVPIEIRLAPFRSTILSEEQLKGSIKGLFSIQTLFQGENEHIKSLRGDVTIDMALFGTYKNPRLFGQVAINRAQIQLPDLGVMLQDLDAEVLFDKTQAAITSFSCTDGLDGKATGSFSAEVHSLQDISYTNTVELSNFLVINKPDARVLTSGTLSVSGTKKEAHLKGDLKVDQAQIIISGQSGTQVPKLDITYVNVKKTQAVSPTRGFFLYYDVSIAVDKDARITGLGLDSEWGGTMHIGGQNTNAVLSGSIEAMQGKLNFANKVFDLTKGTVDFKGDLLQSELSVTASYETQSMIAQIILKGTIDSPKVYLQSNPIMAEKEILSWLIFNKSSSEITPVQGLQLAQVLLKLKSGNNDPDIIDTIKGQFGIDRIDFGAPATVGPSQTSQSAPIQTGNDAAAFQVGKYISDGVLVTLSNDVTNEVNRVGVEAYLTKHIVAQVYVGDDAETQVSLQWKNRY